MIAGPRPGPVPAGGLRVWSTAGVPPSIHCHWARAKVRPLHTSGYHVVLKYRIMIPQAQAVRRGPGQPGPWQCHGSWIAGVTRTTDSASSESDRSTAFIITVTVTAGYRDSDWLSESII